MAPGSAHCTFGTIHVIHVKLSMSLEGPSHLLKSKHVIATLGVHRKHYHRTRQVEFVHTCFMSHPTAVLTAPARTWLAEHKVRPRFSQCSCASTYVACLMHPGVVPLPSSLQQATPMLGCGAPC